MMMMINVIQVDKNNQSIHFCKHSHRGTQCSCGCEVSFYLVLPVNLPKNWACLYWQFKFKPRL